jgi:hypothetical protein
MSRLSWWGWPSSWFGGSSSRASINAPADIEPPTWTGLKLSEYAVYNTVSTGELPEGHLKLRNGIPTVLAEMILKLNSFDESVWGTDSAFFRAADAAVEEYSKSSEEEFLAKMRGQDHHQSNALFDSNIISGLMKKFFKSLGKNQESGPVVGKERILGQLSQEDMSLLYTSRELSGDMGGTDTVAYASLMSLLDVMARLLRAGNEGNRWYANSLALIIVESLFNDDAIGNNIAVASKSLQKKKEQDSSVVINAETVMLEVQSMKGKAGDFLVSLLIHTHGEEIPDGRRYAVVDEHRKGSLTLAQGLIPVLGAAAGTAQDESLSLTLSEGTSTASGDGADLPLCLLGLGEASQANTSLEEDADDVGEELSRASASSDDTELAELSTTTTTSHASSNASDNSIFGTVSPNLACLISRNSPDPSGAEESDLTKGPSFTPVKTSANL